MDKRAAEQYLNKVFGTGQGHVAAAYKDPQNPRDWVEKSFPWPSGKAELLSWVAENEAFNVFVNPALRRDGHTRKKGDMYPSRWLWADVDFQSVPKDKLSEVHERIAELGTYIVASGTGDNAHVYVELDKPVEHDDFIKLNTGLRDYLYGDNKQADNSLLRLPGTTNWKTPGGSPVAVRGGNGKMSSKAGLFKKREFRDARVPVDGESFEWSLEEVPDLPRRLQRALEMTPEDAIGRYRKRHKAVWAMTNELLKREMTPSQVHSLMHTYPPAIDKMAEENGYDVHQDVDRCISAFNALQEAAPDMPEDEQAEAIQVISEVEAYELTEQERLAHIRREAYRLADLSEARKLSKVIEDERTWVAVPPDASWDVLDLLRDPPVPAQYLIGVPPNATRGLCGVKHNVIITAQYKTGKTKFVIATIAKALAHGEDFMGSVPVHTPPGGLVVGHWNCEMDPAELASEYVIPARIERNFTGVNLRGYRVSLLTPSGKAWAVQWLRDRKVKVWTIDSLARLARMAGVSEKDNDEMFDLLMAIDEIKVEAEVDVVFLITHTGRAVQEEGKERARGATAIDDWCDARWIMTNEGGMRFLAVDGRGVGMDASPLVYDEETGHSDKGFGGREDVKADGAVETVMRLVKDSPGITQKALQDALRGKMSTRTVVHTIQDAIDADKIEVREDASGRGRPAKRHYLTTYEKPDGDRRMKATPADVDLRGVRMRQRARK